MVVAMTLPTVRILADDLTGALDSAAAFAVPGRTVRALWTAPGDDDRASLAIDAGTREHPAAEAAARVAALARHLSVGVALKKIDSLMRGSPAEELAACLAHGFDGCVLAPAFPAQGRITRGGVQHAPGPGGPAPVGVDLAGRLAALGLAPVRIADPDAVATAEGRVLLCDATSDADLAAIVAAGRRRPGRVLWCGTGGLAAALADGVPPPPRLPAGPVLFVIGSEHPVSRAQMAALPARLPGHVAVLPLDLPAGQARDATARALRRRIVATAAGPAPAVLVAAGGETLAAVMRAAGARALRLAGAWRPGVPVSVVEGGRWEGATVVSKSGAFGPPGLWAELLHDLPGTVPERGRVTA